MTLQKAGLTVSDISVLYALLSTSLSGLLNPILYGLFDTSYRRGYKNLFKALRVKCCCCIKGQNSIPGELHTLLDIVFNLIGGVMVSMFASSAVDRGFEPRSGQTKDFNISICCLSAKHTTLRGKSKNWLARNQNVSEWGDISTCGLLSQRVGLVQSGPDHHFTKN